MRAPLGIMALVVLAGCNNPVVPDSGAGVGFQDYNTYLRAREGQAAAPAPTTAPLTGFTPDAAAAALDRADGAGGQSRPAGGVTTYAPGPVQGSVIGSTTGERARGNAPAGIQEQSGEVLAVNPGVSDEQDFDAVSARETIESDRARIERNRSEYTVIQPGALPVRTGDNGPSIVEFALATNNAPGVALYSRSRLRTGNALAACANYGSSDQAQEAFLTAGGPDRDRRGLDPDGDGFACDWDPRPFRTALQ